MSSIPVEIELDVSKLPVPEPFQRIAQELSRLPEGAFLHVIHRREPVPLYTLLEKQRISRRVIPGAEPGRLHLLLWPEAARELGEFCRKWSPA